MSGQWVYGAIVVLTLLHGIALLYAYRRGSALTQTGDDAEKYVTEDGVTCPSCGEDNDDGYRYCRQCVSELPAGGSFLEQSSSPQGRRTL